MYRWLEDKSEAESEVVVARLCVSGDRKVKQGRAFKFMKLASQRNRLLLQTVRVLTRKS